MSRPVSRKRERPGTSRAPSRGDPVADAVAEFGRSVASKLGRGGNPEDQLRAPLERLLERLGRRLGVTAVPYGEVQLRELRARPDYAVDVGGNQTSATRVGYVELKAHTRPIPPDWKPRLGDRRQWEKLRALPNVLYTNGLRWAHFHYGELVAPVVELDGSVTDFRRPLQPRDSEYERLMLGFLRWEPESPRTLVELIDITAGLCRLLRDEVAALLRGSPHRDAHPDLALLADDWRNLLFPNLDNAGFCDAYAQTVTFALLLARVDGIVFDGAPLHEIARLLGKSHSLMGRALSVLTDSDAVEELRTVETLRQVIGAVSWETLDDGTTDIYSELYERFLATYDPALRKLSGSYYTPQPVASFMVDFAQSILDDRMGHQWGIASDDVVVIDPAMGTGTFLVEVLRAVADTIDVRQGRGARPARLREFFQKRLIGFEIQTAPYAVAELRLHEALRTRFETEVPRSAARFLTDALEDPSAQQQRLSAAHRVIGEMRSEANRVKRETHVMLVIGNPPHVQNARGRVQWLELRRDVAHEAGGCCEQPSLDEFRGEDHRQFASDLYNLPWCFWRWALWKAFESHDDAPAGIVALLTPASFLKGRAFAGMRHYLRTICDEGWVIGLSPEGDRPREDTRIFGSAVGRQLCIAVFARYGPCDTTTPAVVHTTSVTGKRDSKIAQLQQLQLADPSWVHCRQGWQDPFLPEVRETWAAMPSLKDLMPWSSRGVVTGRNWVYAPDPDVLGRRWKRFVQADTEERRELLIESRNAYLKRRADSLPGFPPTNRSLGDETRLDIDPVPVAYRSFDRQWVIPDKRLMVMPKPPLWSVRSDQQIFVTEQSDDPIVHGPALTFSDLIPDLHHFDGRSGRVYPLFRDAASQEPNLAPGLLAHLGERLLLRPSPVDLLSYVAGVVAHPGYTERFRIDLESPGVRIPLTVDPRLWSCATELGRELLWLHTFAQRSVVPGAWDAIDRLIEEYGPRVVIPIDDTPEKMPNRFHYDPTTETLTIGSGQVAPVPQAVYEYRIGRAPTGLQVVPHWLDYRMRNPRHKKRTSALDDENCRVWNHHMTDELLAMLAVVHRCVTIEPRQRDVFEQICAGPLISVHDLARAHVLPAPKWAARAPRTQEDKQPSLFSNGSETRNGGHIRNRSRESNPSRVWPPRSESKHR